MIGTVEMVADLLSGQQRRSTRLILVDEAGQATEPTTLIPFQVANAHSHVVLVGDHMQLAPTALSKTPLGPAAYDPRRGRHVNERRPAGTE